MNKEYIKHFDTWNELKKMLDAAPFKDFFYAREIWWCALGVNVGSEQDGKNESFERPVLIVKKISKDLLWMIPLTSKVTQEEEYRILTGSSGVLSQLLLEHMRSISSHRLLRKIGTLKRSVFYMTLIKLSLIILQSHTNETPR
jgi:mRNA interferase MazF